ncbi:MAG: hypothetical protein KBS85_04560 [Lachnospiraceae bacterium]|nr:hypothetical protein [Candidatus Merdinaster equi]
MKKLEKLIILVCVFISCVCFAACGAKEDISTDSLVKEMATIASEKDGVPCVDIHELKTNPENYISGCYVYGTVTDLKFNDFTEGTEDYYNYLESISSLVEDATYADDIKLDIYDSLIADAKDTYDYSVTLDGELLGDIKYVTSNKESLLDIGIGDVIYASVKVKPTSVSTLFEYNASDIFVFDKENRDVSTVPKAKKVNQNSSHNNSTSDNSISENNSDEGHTEETLTDYSYSEPFATFEGSGDDVIDEFKPDALCYLHIEFEGKRNFSVKAYYDSEIFGSTYDLIVNASGGAYSGDVFINPDREYMLEVSGNGNWKIEAYYIGTSSTDSYSGCGDTVTPIFVSSDKTYRITTKGKRYFSVKVYYMHSILGLTYDLVVSETEEDYAGTVVVNKKGSQCFFVVNSEREWSIEPRT